MGQNPFSKSAESTVGVIDSKEGDGMENKKIVLSVVQSSNFCAASVIVQVQQ